MVRSVVLTFIQGLFQVKSTVAPSPDTRIRGGPPLTFTMSEKPEKPLHEYVEPP